MTVLGLAGCGGSTTVTDRSSAVTPSAPPAGAHPQAVAPVGTGGSSAGSAQTSGPSGLPRDPAPTAPASAGGGPAKGAPSDAQVRAEVARFQLAVAQYHLDRLNFSNALLDPASLPPGQFNVSIASVFTDYGLPIACGGVLHVPELGVANKTLPCGTEVTFVYGGRAIRVPVLDRGPYIAGREWDLTGAAAEALHFPGLGPIQWRLG